MAESKTNESLEEEIRELEQKLAEKKEQYKETSREEKEIFRDVLQEHIQHARESVEEIGNKKESGETTIPPAVSMHDYAAHISTPSGLHHGGEYQQEIEELVTIALAQGIMQAVRVARNTGNYRLLDDFHDALVDDYYEKMLQARKIASP